MLSLVAVSPDPPSLRSVQPFNNIKEHYLNNPNPKYKGAKRVNNDKRVRNRNSQVVTGRT